MATKPTIANARWADVAGTPATNVVAPLSGTRDIGFQADDPVPSGIHNYLWRQIYLWFIYVDAFLTDIHTWVAAQTFSALATFNAGIATTTAAISGALTAASAAISGNATVGGTLGVTGQTTLTGQLNMNDNAVLASGKALSLISTAKITSASNPTKTTAIVNEMHAKTLVKAWALVDINHTAGASVTEGLNMGVVTIGPAADFHVIRANFATGGAMSNGNYHVSWGAYVHPTAGTITCRPAVIPGSQTGSHFDFVVQGINNTGPASGFLDFTTEDCTVSFEVYAQQ